MIRALLIALAISATVPQAHANDLVTTFKKLNNQRKGPFDLNVLQGSAGRSSVDSSPAGEFQFQAAYRNSIAMELANKHDFYVGNLFTTNYYELMGEYVYGNARSNHPLNHAGLLSVANQALPKASSMVRHWVLEKHYLSAFHGSALTRGFRLRGISGSEFEQAYAVHFFNFYLTATTEDQAFLPALLLAKGSPIAGSSTLERARTLIAAVYDTAKERYGQDNAGVRRLYDLRNYVHNQLSQSVIDRLSAFLRDYPGFAAEDRRIVEVRDILRAYYSVSAKKVSDLAKVAGVSAMQAAADEINAKGVTVDRLFEMSNRLAEVRTALSVPGQVPTEQKSNYLVLILVGSQYLNKEILSMNSISSPNVVRTVINLIYAEGFLMKDNADYFQSEAAAAANVKAAGAQLADVIGIASDSLTEAFKPSFDQWLKIEPKMQYFVDNTIKSSALNTAAIVAEKLKK